MARHGRVVIAAAAAVVLALTGCSAEVAGTAESGPATAAEPRPSENASPPDNPAGPEPVVAGPGQCVNGNDVTPVDCRQPHTVEITAEGTFGGGMPEQPPDRDTVFAAVFPECRQAAADYLGNEDYDASTLGAWLLWAGREDWTAGKRWYRCGVAELGADGSALPRTGSVRNALAGDGLYEFQVCSATRPSQELPRLVSCDRPHSGEAVGTVAMGRPAEPFPSERAFNDRARPACTRAVREYVGAERDDVTASWRWPDEVNWRYGFTNITCYAETVEPVTKPVRGLRSSRLPN
ncbi:septum formation family protein [Prauserella oleivorans]|uniref:Septum formation family protein n=1 Tax=Prauserella oleivorans TaxID=1478153 RepID=A0ABW5WI90_9PSEU